MENKRIAIYGGSFNPPGIHHELIIKKLLKEFEKVIIVPCGFRNDKITEKNIKDFVSAENRKIMMELAFDSVTKDGAEINYFDLSNNIYTRTIDLYNRFKNLGDIWIVIGADIICGDKPEDSEIQKEWKEGKWIWDNLNFAVLERDGFKINNMPSHSILIKNKIYGSSSEIRRRIRSGVDFSDLVNNDVNKFIINNKLYL